MSSNRTLVSRFTKVSLIPVAVPCPKPDLRNGRLSAEILTNGQYPENTTATVTCDSGYTLTGAPVILCLASGKWSHRIHWSHCRGK